MVDHDDIRRGHGFHPLRVTRIIHESDGTRSFVLDIPDALLEVFRYRAGQFCTFRLRLGGEEHLRSYSMSSAQDVDADFTVTVKRVPAGLVSGWFHDRVVEGDVLEVTRPAGVFCVRDGDRAVVAFCGGSGVTPVISIAKSVLVGTQRPVKVLYANRDRVSVIFADQLGRMRGAHPGRFEVTHHYDFDAGFLDAGAVAAFVAGGLDADFYVCGPGPFMDLVESSLLDLGVDPGRILIERFLDAGQHASPPTAEAAVEAAAGAAVGVPESVTVILNGKKTTVAYQPGWRTALKRTKRSRSPGTSTGIVADGSRSTHRRTAPEGDPG